MVDCIYCTTQGDCRYNWHCPGCRARMLAALPNQEQQHGWLDRWREQGDAAMADAVEQIITSTSA